jgi:GT2 family glycosyltransferase
METLTARRGWDQIRWVLDRASAAVANEGIGACLRRISRRLTRVLRGQSSLLPLSPRDLDAQYRLWRLRHAPQDTVEAMSQQVAELAYRPVISLVMRVSGAHPLWIARAIESILLQIYPSWELSVYADSTMSRSIQGVIEELSPRDPRITLKVRPGEDVAARGIGSLLSSQAGDFVGVVGQHDELSVEALFAVVAHINEHPDLDLLYSDHDIISPDGEYRAPFFKPDWSPDLLLSMNYLFNLCIFRRTTLSGIDDCAGRTARDGLYDLLLRLTEIPRGIGHIAQVLYHARRDGRSGGESHASMEIGAVEQAMRRRGERGRVETVTPGKYRIIRELRTMPLVSILVPTRDHSQLLEQCLESIEKGTSYDRYEILVLDNGSSDPHALRYLDTVSERWSVHRSPGPFNFSAINNVGAKQASGEYLLFLNNDVKAMVPGWLTAMVAEAQRPGVGAVGAKLLYPSGSIQHAGIVLGVNGIAGHAFRHTPLGRESYYGLADVVRNCSAVTAACLLMRKDLFMRVQGFDERLRVEFNDIDLCLRIRQLGYRIVYTPEAVLCHYENATRKGSRSPEDEAVFAAKWGDIIRRGDPYYSPHLTRSREDWSLNI